MAMLKRSVLTALLLLGAAGAEAYGGWPQVVAPGAYFGFSYGGPVIHRYGYHHRPRWHHAPRFHHRPYRHRGYREHWGGRHHDRRPRHHFRGHGRGHHRGGPSFYFRYRR